MTDAGFRGVLRSERGASVDASDAWGADGEGVALTPESTFLTASISKSFVAASVLVLVERGVIALDDKVTPIVGEPASTWRHVSIGDLLAHTGGLPHFSDLDGFDLSRAWPRRELIAWLAAAPLRFGPGRGWHYSTPAYLLLAHIVELVSETPYATFLATNVLQPLGLASTSVGAPPPGVHAVRGTIAGESAPGLHHSLLFSHVWSNAADLARWPRALAGSSFFRMSAATAFDARIRFDDGDGMTELGYACGWFTGRLNGSRLVFHPGDQPGISTFLLFAPEEDIAVVALAAEPIDLEPVVRRRLAETLGRAAT